MNQKLKDKAIQLVHENNKSEYKYKGGNEGTILLRSPERIYALEFAYPHFICCRRSKDESLYIDFYTGQLWHTVIQKACNCRGRRFHKAIVDSSIEDEIFINLSLPCLSFYCSSIEFFD